MVGGPHFTFLNVENGIRSLSLGEDDVFSSHREDLLSMADSGEEGIGIEVATSLGCHEGRHRNDDSR